MEEAGALVCLAPGDLAPVCLPWKSGTMEVEPVSGGVVTRGFMGAWLSRSEAPLGVWIRGCLGMSYGKNRIFFFERVKIGSNLLYT